MTTISKTQHIIDLLSSEKGTTIDDICQVSGWQPHTVRGFFANTIKKQRGLTIVSTKKDQSERHYRIECDQIDVDIAD